eukprot:8683674-Pyramimonas_sp.AAC.2
MVYSDDQHGFELENVQEIPARVKNLVSAWQVGACTLARAHALTLASAQRPRWLTRSPTLLAPPLDALNPPTASS